MQLLIAFIRKYKDFFYFIFLAFVALIITINNYSFHRSKIISSTNFISGTLLDISSKITDYINLKDINDDLMEENKKLKNKLNLFMYEDSIIENTVKDSTLYHQRYSYINGNIRKNEFRKPSNFLTINLGSKNGIEKEMAVINNKGIIGIIDNVSENYSRVQSIININSRVNARLKNSFYFGSLTWNGKDYNTVQLTDIPRQANLKKGDTIITGGKSTIFPEGIPIGVISDIPAKLTASNTLDVKLFNDMSNLGYIYVVKSFDKLEIRNLEKKEDE